MTLTPEQIAELRRGLLPNSAFLTSYEVGIALLSAAEENARLREVLEHIASLDDRHIFAPEKSVLRSWFYEYRTQARAALEPSHE